jgi:SAM-dependent methyltransferase
MSRGNRARAASREDGGEWFEDEGFWTAYAPIMFDEARWAEVPAVVDGIERLVGLRPGAAILDACCGPGRHSLELASRGYRVTGIDITEAYLEAARESAASAADPAAPPNPRFLRADIRDFEADEPFDLAINLYTSFGYFADPADDLAALRRLRAALKPGGALVLETTGRETAARDFTAGESFERGGWRVRTEFSTVGDWEGLRNRWILTRGDEIVDRAFVLRLYSGPELEAALLSAGFATARILGGVDGSPYDGSAASLVALARA